MADENKSCSNCLFHTEFEIDHGLIRCRFNAPIPKMYNIGEDMTRYNITRFPKCPGPWCGQWKSEFEEPEIVPEEELPGRIDKDDKN